MYKICVVGDLGVGKTALIKRFTFGSFQSRYKETIGVEFEEKAVTSDSGFDMKLGCYDIAGMERFGCMLKGYIKETKAYMVGFDFTRQNTFEAVDRWTKAIRSQHSKKPGEKFPPIILIGLKVDLKNNGTGGEVSLSAQEIDEYSQQHGFNAYFEVNVKDDPKSVAAPFNYCIEHFAKALSQQPNLPFLSREPNIAAIFELKISEYTKVAGNSWFFNSQDPARKSSVTELMVAIKQLSIQEIDVKTFMHQVCCIAREVKAAHDKSKYFPFTESRLVRALNNATQTCLELKLIEKISPPESSSSSSRSI